MITEMSALDKLITARVRLQKSNPFFSYLVMGLELIEAPDKTASCGVDGKGNLYFNPKWISKWNDEQLKTILTHEVMHIAFQHLAREKKRNHKLFNVACDIVVNNILTENNFEFGDLEGIRPKWNEVEIFGKVIKKINNKVAEDIYKELKEAEKEQKGSGKGKGEGEGKSKKGSGSGTPSENENENENQEDYEGKGFDDHIRTENPSQEEQKELDKAQEDWKKRLVGATVYAKNQGNLPAGMDKYIEELLDAKLNWKALLYKYVTRELMVDYNWSYPSRKSIALGTYLPSIKKENVNITIAIDTSGSIDREELTEFLSEISGITKGFENITLNVFCMDTEVQSHVVIRNGETDELIKNIKGGGGTDFREVYNYVRENIPQTRLLIFFTDGFARFPEYEEFKTLWILTKRSRPEEDIPFGETIKLEGDEE